MTSHVLWEALRERLNVLIDRAQLKADGARVAHAGRLLERIRDLEREAVTVDEEIARLEGGPVTSSSDAPLPVIEAETQSPRRVSRPPSFLLLPAGGPDSSQHFAATVQTAVDPARLNEWCPQQAEQLMQRITDRLAVWGLRDNTRGFPHQGVEPMIWNRIETGTLALFSDSENYFCAATVVGKCTSADGSADLWESPEFRWLIFMTGVRDIAVPTAAVIEGAGYDPGYRINRQAIVPKPRREPGLWIALQRYGLGETAEGAHL